MKQKPQSVVQDHRGDIHVLNELRIVRITVDDIGVYVSLPPGIVALVRNEATGRECVEAYQGEPTGETIELEWPEAYCPNCLWQRAHCACIQTDEEV